MRRGKNNKMKPKVKEKWRRDATIKIETLLEVTENPKGCFSNKEKVVNANIKFPYGKEISCSFKATKKGKREMLKLIKEELYL